MNAPLDDLPVTLSEIESAAELLTGVIERTPIAHSRAFNPYGPKNSHNSGYDNDYLLLVSCSLVHPN